jgi:hypothetical protein
VCTGLGLLMVNINQALLLFLKPDAECCRALGVRYGPKLPFLSACPLEGVSVFLSILLLLRASMVFLTLSFMKSYRNSSLLMCPSELLSISAKMRLMLSWDYLPYRNFATS